MQIRTIEAGVLAVSYAVWGPEDGWPCVLGHGFPYDAHAYAETAPMLADAGARVIVPWLRGYGATRFLSAETPRSGEQAVLGADMLAFLDALGIEKAVLGGYDWGGRACCIIAALWPERVHALVSGNSYNIQNIAKAMDPGPASVEAANWYQYFFHAEAGRNALERDRRDVARQLWRMWSPEWRFSVAEFERSAAAFDTPDFVDVVIHSYRHRYGLVPGDPAAAGIEARLAEQPPITVPVITIDGQADRVGTRTAHHRDRFRGPYDYRVWHGAGHNLPQERPRLWAAAVLDARALAGGD
ncbi:MAG: alpha/beta hydrolase [Pseudomonadota bacterium]